MAPSPAKKSARRGNVLLESFFRGVECPKYSCLGLSEAKAVKSSSTLSTPVPAPGTLKALPRVCFCWRFENQTLAASQQILPNFQVTRRRLRLERTCLSRPILNSTLEQVPVLSLSNFSVKCLSPGNGSRPTPRKDEAVLSPCSISQHSTQLSPTPQESFCVQRV